MRNYWPIILVLIGLSGLGLLQYQWLKMGLVLEKQQLDREVRQAMAAVVNQLEDEPALSNAIVELQAGQRWAQAIPDSLQATVREELRGLLSRELRQRGLPTGFALRLSEGRPHEPLLGDEAYDPGPETAYRTYTHRLLGPLEQRCSCELFLQWQLPPLLPIVLERLSGLLWAALGFVALLLIGFVLLMRSVRRQRRLVGIKNDFINHLTHEMKTPVFSISLLSRLLRKALEQQQYTKAEDYLQRVEQENTRLKGQVHQILELASLEHPRYQLQLQVIGLPGVLQPLLTGFEQRIKEAGGRLCYDASPEALQLQADPEHLSNALASLLDNALRYGGQPPAVTFAVKAAGKWLDIRVQDNGPGIPAREQKRIFRKFYRGASSREAAGFGLGLSYARQVARLHGGALKVERSGTEGSVFLLRLPMVRRSAAQSAALPRPIK